MQSLPQRNIMFFCFTDIAGLPRGWKPAICPLREEDFLFFPSLPKRKLKIAWWQVIPTRSLYIRNSQRPNVNYYQG